MASELKLVFFVVESGLATKGSFLKKLGHIRLGWVKRGKAAGAFLAMLFKKYLST